MRTIFVAAGAAVLSVVLAACGTSPNHDDMPGMDHSTHGSGDVPDGLSKTVDGYTLELKSTLSSSAATRFSFVIGKAGQPVTRFQTEQTKKLHLYLIRDDLAGFQHLHPTMAADGVWSVEIPAVAPGAYRAYAQIAPAGVAGAVVLSDTTTVAGAVEQKPIPAAADSVTVDGYTVAFAGGTDSLTATVSKNGKPVENLEPYLGVYAHLTAFHEGDLAIAHLHPSDTVTSAGGGPDLNFQVEVPERGTYRMFMQFVAGGVLHTAAVTRVLG